MHDSITSSHLIQVHFITNVSQIDKFSIELGLKYVKEYDTNIPMNIEKYM